MWRIFLWVLLGFGLVVGYQPGTKGGKSDRPAVGLSEILDEGCCGPPPPPPPPTKQCPPDCEEGD